LVAKWNSVCSKTAKNWWDSEHNKIHDFVCKKSSISLHQKPLAVDLACPNMPPICDGWFLTDEQPS